MLLYLERKTSLILYSFLFNLSQAASPLRYEVICSMESGPVYPMFYAVPHPLTDGVCLNIENNFLFRLRVHRKQNV